MSVFETVLGKVVRREEEARLDTVEGRKEERKDTRGSGVEAERLRLVEKERQDKRNEKPSDGA